MHKVLSTTILSLLSLPLAGCSSVQLDSPGIPGLPKKDCYFVANTSPVNFEDLKEFYDSGRFGALRDLPVFEGFYDEVPELTDTGEVIRAYLERRPESEAFSPEAEWAVVFRPPLRPGAMEGGKIDLRALKDYEITFTGFVEGKRINELLSRTTNKWLDASCGNNFVRAVDPDAPKIPWNTLEYWNDFFRAEGTKYDSLFFKITHMTEARELYEFVGSFKEMREDLSSVGPEFELKTIVEKVYEDFSRRCDQEEGADFVLRGINLGAHGGEAALVNQRRRRYWAFMLALPSYVNPFLYFPPFKEQCSLTARVRRRVAKSIMKNEDTLVVTPITSKAEFHAEIE